MHDQELEKLLRDLPKFTRSKAADRAFHKKLAQLSEREYSSSDVPVGALPMGFLGFLRGRFAMAGAFAVLFLLATGTFAAYQPSVTRGSLLYPWKQAAERVELAAAFSPLSAVNTHMRFSDRRIEEAENILAANPGLALIPIARAHGDEIHVESEEAVWLALTLEDMQREVEFASAIVEARVEDTGEVEQALARIEESVARHVEKLGEFELRRIEEDGVKELLGRIVQEENGRFEGIKRARKAVREAQERKETKVKVRLEKLEKRQEEGLPAGQAGEERKEEAREKQEKKREDFEERREKRKEDKQEERSEKKTEKQDRRENRREESENSRDGNSDGDTEEARVKKQKGEEDKPERAEKSFDPKDKPQNEHFTEPKEKGRIRAP